MITDEQLAEITIAVEDGAQLSQAHALALIEEVARLRTKLQDHKAGEGEPDWIGDCHDRAYNRSTGAMDDGEAASHYGEDVFSLVCKVRQLYTRIAELGAK